ncbi:MAG: helix-turn-helix domain-containing protein [Bacteroidetes bacterium]|nr:helix-turn-helix domain-containing protein [Bacteroidota bacterium]MBL6943228.1 helix-turn-helix domain-containing protein [Bacteroidales bacterium]
MMDVHNNKWVAMSDHAIVKEIGAFLKHHRIAQNRTQKEIAEKAGINRTTLSLLESGEVVKLSTLIKVLRILDLLYILDVFNVKEEISPIEYARLKKSKRLRATSKSEKSTNDNKSEW